jgi:hypothetical protein
MITRDTAAAIVRFLERALEHLLKAGALADAADTEDPTRQQMDLLWVPTANTADLLAVINGAYPDLAGPDVPFRTAPHEGPGKRLGKSDVEVIGTNLGHALELLERATATFHVTPGNDAMEKERLAARFAESITAVRSTLQRLGIGS